MLMKKPIATVLKAQGIKGEVKMASSLDATLLLSLKTVYIDGNATAVKTIRSDGKFLYVLLEGITDRNHAETLRGKTVYAEKQDINLPDDTYFIDDIIGCKVKDSAGNLLGELTEVYQNGVSADVYTLKTPMGGIARFPFIKALNAAFDIDDNVLTVDKTIISEIVFYENEN